ncbi:hypothetical protein C8R44DRAFT_888057 [Mycena epipterygia]|nr:hypothetical protein C8R44DRAFT_888057 [Mycena epipterygia]
MRCVPLNHASPSSASPAQSSYALPSSASPFSSICDLRPIPSLRPRTPSTDHPTATGSGTTSLECKQQIKPIDVEVKDDVSEGVAASSATASTAAATAAAMTTKAAKIKTPRQTTRAANRSRGYTTSRAAATVSDLGRRGECGGGDLDREPRHDKAVDSAEAGDSDSQIVAANGAAGGSRFILLPPHPSSCSILRFHVCSASCWRISSLPRFVPSSSSTASPSPPSRRIPSCHVIVYHMASFLQCSYPTPPIQSTPHPIASSALRHVASRLLHVVPPLLPVPVPALLLLPSSTNLTLRIASRRAAPTDSPLHRPASPRPSTSSSALGSLGSFRPRSPYAAGRSRFRFMRVLLSPFLYPSLSPPLSCTSSALSFSARSYKSCTDARFPLRVEKMKNKVIKLTGEVQQIAQAAAAATDTSSREADLENEQ